MQNDYILIPWDSMHKSNVLYTKEIDNSNIAEHTTNDNNVLNAYMDYAFIILFVYSIIIASFLFFIDENTLHRKDKAVKRG